MISEDAAKLREGLRCDMERAEQSEKALEQQMNELDTALTHLKRLSLHSCSLDDVRIADGKRSGATTVPTPETPQPQLSMPSDWSKLTIGWCNSRVPTQSLAPTVEEVSVCDSPDCDILLPAGSKSLNERSDAVAITTQEATMSAESKDVLDYESEMLYHLSGLKTVLCHLRMQPDERARLARSTISRLRSVRQLIDEEMVAHHQSCSCGEGVLSRHPSSTSDVFSSLTSTSVGIACDCKEDGSLSCLNLHNDCALGAESSDGNKSLVSESSDCNHGNQSPEPKFSHQLLNLSSDMESAQQSQEALLQELSNADAALSRLKCMSHSFQSLNECQLTQKWLSGFRRGGLELLKEVKSFGEGDEENDREEVGGEVSRPCWRSTQSVPGLKSRESSCGESALPAEVLLLHGNDDSLSSTDLTDTEGSSGELELSLAQDVNSSTEPVSYVVSLEGKEQLAHDMENLNMDIEHAQSSQDILIAELENLDSALTRLKLTTHRFGSLRGAKSSFVQCNQEQNCSAMFAKDSVVEEFASGKDEDTCLQRLVSLPISTNHSAEKAFPVDLLLANFPAD